MAAYRSPGLLAGGGNAVPGCAAPYGPHHHPPPSVAVVGVALSSRRVAEWAASCTRLERRRGPPPAAAATPPVGVRGGEPTCGFPVTTTFRPVVRAPAIECCGHAARRRGAAWPGSRRAARGCPVPDGPARKTSMTTLCDGDDYGEATVVAVPAADGATVLVGTDSTRGESTGTVAVLLALGCRAADRVAAHVARVGGRCRSERSARVLRHPPKKCSFTGCPCTPPYYIAGSRAL